MAVSWNANSKHHGEWDEIMNSSSGSAVGARWEKMVMGNSNQKELGTKTRANLRHSSRGSCIIIL